MKAKQSDKLEDGTVRRGQGMGEEGEGSSECAEYHAERSIQRVGDCGFVGAL